MEMSRILGILSIGFFLTFTSCGKNPLRVVKGQASVSGSGQTDQAVPHPQNDQVDWDQLVDIEYPVSTPSTEPKSDLAKSPSQDQSAIKVEPTEESEAEEDYSQIPREIFVPK